MSYVSMNTMELVTERLEEMEYEEDCCEILSSAYDVGAAIIHSHAVYARLL